jgi:hypothetical protein
MQRDIIRIIRDGRTWVVKTWYKYAKGNNPYHTGWLDIYVEGHNPYHTSWPEGLSSKSIDVIIGV